MTAVWTSILVVAVANFAIKAAGPVLLGGRELPGPVVAVIALLGPALLMALVVVGFSDGSSLRVDAQAAGVAVAGGAFLLRVPMLAAIALGALAAALLRLPG